MFCILSSGVPRTGVMAGCMARGLHAGPLPMRTGEQTAPGSHAVTRCTWFPARAARAAGQGSRPSALVARAVGAARRWAGLLLQFCLFGPVPQACAPVCCMEVLCCASCFGQPCCCCSHPSQAITEAKPLAQAPPTLLRPEVDRQDR